MTRDLYAPTLAPEDYDEPCWRCGGGRILYFAEGPDDFFEEECDTCNTPSSAYLPDPVIR